MQIHHRFPKEPRQKPGLVGALKDLGNLQDARTPARCGFFTVSPRNPGRNPDWLAPSKTLGTYRTPGRPGHSPGADSPSFPQGTPVAEPRTGWRCQRLRESTGHPDARPVQFPHRFPEEPRQKPRQVGANQPDARIPGSPRL